MASDANIPAYRLFTDTDPAVEQMLVARLQSLPPWRKLEMMAELNANMRAFALAGLRGRHPGADDAELKRRLADLLLGPELAEEVYGPLPHPGESMSR